MPPTAGYRAWEHPRQAPVRSYSFLSTSRLMRFNSLPFHVSRSGVALALPTTEARFQSWQQTTQSLF